ncbi:MAG: hypothetical protein D6758_11520 [Gammaproteobacteria bacterium]|nr:MAG: hypothetical protein D6758_11520 [Gammaproteobacteria bacterium]
MRRLILLLLCLPVWCAQADEPDMLLYGQARFAALTERPLEVLTLLENDHTGATHIDNDFHNEDHVLAIEASLRLGLADQAIELADHLLFTARKESHKSKARLLKARALAQQKRFDELVRWLEKSLSHLKGDMRDEAWFLVGRGYTETKRLADAARALSRISKGSIWAAYGYYNLALKYAQDDPDPSRAWVALRVAAALAGDTREGQALRDRALTVAGNLALEVQDPEKAAQFVKAVRADAMEAPSAIYLYGMSEAQAGRLRTAVRTWHRAKKYALYMPGVAETFQSIAWAYVQENLKGSAIDAYLEAISVYEKEQQQTRQLLDELRQKGFLELVRAARAEQKSTDWFLNTELVNNTPRVMFVNALMTDAGFFGQVTELLQIRDMASSLEANRRKLAILEDAYRRASGGSTRQAVNKIDRLEQRLGQLIARRNDLVGAYKEALAANDFARIGSESLLKARKRLDAVVAELKRLKGVLPGPTYRELSRRAIRLRGRLVWEDMAGMDESRQSFADRIKVLDGLIASMRDSISRLRERARNGRVHFAERMQQIQRMRARADATGDRLQRVLKTMDQAMTTEAINRLEQHLDRMARFHVRSQLALVNLYDALAVAEYAPERVRENQR